MMRLLFLSFLVFFSTILSAQTTEWAPIGAKWWWSVSDEDVVGEAYYYWEVVGKDSFEGEWVSIIQSDLFGYDSMVVPGYDTMFTFSRNDSVFLYHDYSGEYKLLYDFGAQVGDTIRFATFDDGIYGMDEFTVVVENIIYNRPGQNRFYKRGDFRTFQTKNIDTAALYWTHNYNEGFGNNTLSLKPVGIFVYGPQLRCYEDQEIEVHYYYKEYSTGVIEELPCDFYKYTSNKEVIWNRDALKLYPNPTSNFLQIEVSKELSKANYKIIDWIGNVKGKGRAEKLSSGLDVSSFSSGIYILSVENEKEIYFQKFLIQ